MLNMSISAARKQPFSNAVHTLAAKLPTRPARRLASLGAWVSSVLAGREAHDLADVGVRRCCAWALSGLRVVA